jgi:hypothetical protein
MSVRRIVKYARRDSDSAITHGPLRMSDDVIVLDYTSLPAITASRF